MRNSSRDVFLRQERFRLLAPLRFLEPLRFLDWPDSDMAMAIACLRLLTFLPEPERSVPRFFSRMTLVTFAFCALVAMIYVLRWCA